MKHFDFFAGIGSFHKAGQEVIPDYEFVGFSEFDKHAIKSYCAIHNVSESLNWGDITKIIPCELPDFDLMTWGFPCTDISILGKQKGIIKDVTRSGLYYCGLDILKVKKPKYSIIENVANLLSKSFKSQFYSILEDLENAGYNNYFKILNAKDYGVAQNRERVFIVSIRNDIDTGNFEFQEKMPLLKTFKDYVDFDCEVPRKILYSFNVKGGNFGNKFKSINCESYSNCVITKPNWGAITNNFYTKDLKVYNITEIIENNITVYANSAKMNFNLMDFSDDDFNLAKTSGVSNSQLYKQAGNSIVVAVAKSVLTSLVEAQSKPQKPIYQQIKWG